MKKTKHTLCFCIILFSFPGITTASSKQFMSKLFKNYQGCFLMADAKTGKVIHQYGKEQCHLRTRPCSTFKLPNSLIALQEGVVKNTSKKKFRWDGKKRFYSAWNQDQSLASALRYSTVWVYQRIAAKVGRKKMLSWLRRLRYGNQAPSQNIRRFWLDGSLKISSTEQLRFMRRLVMKLLPFKRKHQEELISMMEIFKTSKQLVVGGKTGSGRTKGRWVLGWFVGYLKVKHRTLVFVTRITGKSKASGNIARKMTWKILRDQKLILATKAK